MADDNNNDDGVFVYTQGAVVPHDVVRVRIHPSVTVIPEEAFNQHEKLKEVELCEGLLVIGVRAFFGCHSLNNIKIPLTITTIEDSAFGGGIQSQMRLHDGIESIGRYAFSCGNITNFKVPPLISYTSRGMFSGCTRMFSVEILESVTYIQPLTFSSCISLRNVAIPPSAGIEWNAYGNGGPYSAVFCRDLVQLFGEPLDESSPITYALKHRFDNLPIHKMIYYQSYNNMTVDELNNSTNIRISRRRSKVNPSGSQQDCLGMTPLHIMACSTAQNIELYRLLIEKYPENLITKDRWGALPLLYAVWGEAPSEIIQFLVKSYTSLSPDHVLNLTEMIQTLGAAGAPVRIIQNLLDMQEEDFPNQLIDWVAVIEKLAVEPRCGSVCRKQTYQFLVKCGFMERINAIGLKQWRDDVINTVMSPSFIMPYDVKEGNWLDGIKSKLILYEAEYHRLKEATSLLELALWKIKLNDHEGEERQNKKMRIEESDVREQCRINCGADIVIQHVLPYLLISPADADESGATDESSRSSRSSESDGEANEAHNFMY